MRKYDLGYYCVFAVMGAVAISALTDCAFAQSSTPQASPEIVKTSPLSSPKKAETLVGRGNGVVVVRPDGTVEETPKNTLVFRNRASASTNEAPQPKNSSEANEKPADAPAAKQPPQARNVSKNQMKQKVDSAAAAQAEAVKKADIEKIRKLQWQEAWFYDKDGKPLSQEEVGKRVESGDVGGIQAKDIYLNEWKAESSEKNAPSTDNGK